MDAKASAGGPRKRVEECTGQANFENDCNGRREELIHGLSGN